MFSMILLLHIIVALISIVQAGILYVKPVRANFTIQYGLIAGTLTTGTVLVVSMSSHMLQACVSGLVYLAIVTTALALSRRRAHAFEKLTD